MVRRRVGVGVLVFRSMCLISLWRGWPVAVTFWWRSVVRHLPQCNSK